MKGERLAILTEGLLRERNAKTAHGVIRYGRREVIAVVDSGWAGRTADEVVPFCARPVPVVASVAEAVARGASCLLVGVAPMGGKLDSRFRALLLEAIDEGLDIEAGLHTLLSDDPELRAAADASGVRLRDLRAAPPDLDVPRAPRSHRTGLRVVHSVGSDVMVGKKTVALELDHAARKRGLPSVFVATGQTGIAISGWGIAVDHVISDYVAGAAERLVHQGAEQGDVLFVEGQGALFHPGYSGVTLGLLHGSVPDVLVLAHRAGTTALRAYPSIRLPSLPELIAAYESVCRPISPARTAAVVLDTSGFDDTAARAAIAEAEEASGVAADDVVRFGAERVLDAVLAELDRHEARAGSALQPLRTGVRSARNQAGRLRRRITG